MEAEPRLTRAQKRALLRVARQTLLGLFEAEPATPPEPIPGLGNGAAFVTLRKDASLRGCVGNLDNQRPLTETVQRSASLAANDSRFARVTPDEIEDLEITISVLGPMMPLEHPTRIVIGAHGLLILEGPASGVLLPQVAVENGLDPETFLAMACRKARLPEDAWQKGAVVFVFTTCSFSTLES